MCLKYVGVDVTYPSAVANCEAERSSVIKIDSQEKFDIFKDYVGTNVIYYIDIPYNKLYFRPFKKHPHPSYKKRFHELS